MTTNTEWIEYYRFHPSEFESFVKFAQEQADRLAALESENKHLRDILSLILEVHPYRNDKANYSATVRQLAKMGLEAK